MKGVVKMRDKLQEIYDTIVECNNAPLYCYISLDKLEDNFVAIDEALAKMEQVKLIIKELFDIEIDLRPLPQQSFIIVKQKIDNQIIYLATISRDKAKLLKEYIK